MKWISQTNQDGSCYLLTREMVENWLRAVEEELRAVTEKSKGAPPTEGGCPCLQNFNRIPHRDRPKSSWDEVNSKNNAFVSTVGGQSFEWFSADHGLSSLGVHSRHATADAGTTGHNYSDPSECVTSSVPRGCSRKRPDWVGTCSWGGRVHSCIEVV